MVRVEIQECELCVWKDGVVVQSAVVDKDGWSNKYMRFGGIVDLLKSVGIVLDPRISAARLSHVNGKVTCLFV